MLWLTKISLSCQVFFDVVMKFLIRTVRYLSHQKWIGQEKTSRLNSERAPWKWRDSWLDYYDKSDSIHISHVVCVCSWGLTGCLNTNHRTSKIVDSCSHTRAQLVWYSGQRLQSVTPFLIQYFVDAYLLHPACCGRWVLAQRFLQSVKKSIVYSRI